MKTSHIIFLFTLLLFINCKPQKKDKISFKKTNIKPLNIDSIDFFQKQIDSINFFRTSIFNKKKKLHNTFYVDEFECCWYYNPKRDNEVILFGKSNHYSPNIIWRLMIIKKLESCENFEQNWFDNKIDAKFIDVNFDNNKDFIIQSKSKSGNGSVFYNVYTFFSKDLKFFYSDELSGKNFKIDVKTKTTSTFQKLGATKDIRKKFSFRGDGVVHFTEVINREILKRNTKYYLKTTYNRYKYNRLLESKTDTIQLPKSKYLELQSIKTDAIRIEQPKTVKHIVKAVIDTVSNNEIKNFIENKSMPIYSYYQKDIDDLDAWSQKFLGNPQGVDITYAECFIFKVTSNFENKKYPVSNLSDFHYKTAYVFKAADTVAIHLKIDKNHRYFKNNPKVHPDKILKVTDTVMYPIKLSLINGYVKNKSLFYKNGRVKKMEVFVNKKSKGIVVLLDTPLVQEFSINALFKRDDIITLKPLTYYRGTTFDDVCISEIQHSLGYTAHPSINRKAAKYHITGN